LPLKIGDLLADQIQANMNNFFTPSPVAQQEDVKVFNEGLSASSGFTEVNA